MRVADVMTTEVISLHPEDTIARAAQVMWDRDCGCVPIVDERDRVIGVLTDRDACMAAYLTGRPLHELPIAASMSRTVVTCGPEDTVAHAEHLMREHRVRRLPVVGMQGTLAGMLTLNDLARTAAGARWPDRAVCAEAIEATLAAVGETPKKRRHA